MTDWVTIPEGAVALAVPESTLRRWATQGKITAKKSGRDWLVRLPFMPQARKVRVLRLIEYEFDTQQAADEHLLHMTHSLNVGEMRMRSSIIQMPWPDYGFPPEKDSLDLIHRAKLHP